MKLKFYTTIGEEIVAERFDIEADDIDSAFDDLAQWAPAVAANPYKNSSIAFDDSDYVCYFKNPTVYWEAKWHFNDYYKKPSL